MANYYISGIWKAQGRITHVMLHGSAANGGVLKGNKTTEQAVIDILNRPGNTVSTIEWNYATGNWQMGAGIMVVYENFRYILRTHRNGVVYDNLGHMIDMEYFF